MSPVISIDKRLPLDRKSIGDNLNLPTTTTVIMICTVDIASKLKVAQGKCPRLITAAAIGKLRALRERFPMIMKIMAGEINTGVTNRKYSNTTETTDKWDTITVTHSESTDNKIGDIV